MVGCLDQVAQQDGDAQLWNHSRRQSEAGRGIDQRGSHRAAPLGLPLVHGSIFKPSTQDGDAVSEAH